MNVPIINAPYRAHPCAGGRHIDLACAKAIELFRGRVFDCRRYPGANASIAYRLRPPWGQVRSRGKRAKSMQYNLILGAKQ